MLMTFSIIGTTRTNLLDRVGKSLIHHAIYVPDAFLARILFYFQWLSLHMLLRIAVTKCKCKTSRHFYKLFNKDATSAWPSNLSPSLANSSSCTFARSFLPPLI